MASVFDEPVPDEWTMMIVFKDEAGAELLADVKNAFVQDGILHVYFNDGVNHFYNFDAVKFWTARPHMKERDVNES